jgi:hypothetical protein
MFPTVLNNIIPEYAAEYRLLAWIDLTRMLVTSLCEQPFYSDIFINKLLNGIPLNDLPWQSISKNINIMHILECSLREPALHAFAKVDWESLSGNTSIAKLDCHAIMQELMKIE